MKKSDKFKNRLPIREDVKTVAYHRNPTLSEIRFGHGATHYCDFDIKECTHLHDGKRYLKAWIVSPYDGLRYYY